MNIDHEVLSLFLGVTSADLFPRPLGINIVCRLPIKILGVIFMSKKTVRKYGRSISISSKVKKKLNDDLTLSEMFHLFML
jgi:hypothetical protein